MEEGDGEGGLAGASATAHADALTGGNAEGQVLGKKSSMAL